MLYYIKNMGRKVAVLGLGLEGKDLVSYLQKNGDNITVFDQKLQEEIDFSGVNKQGLKFICGPDYLKPGFSSFEVVYRSPGVYRYIPGLVEAENQGIIISSDVKLFFEKCPAKIIGVTGTKGKGTTSTLIYEILKKAGKDVYLVGNIGKPSLELLPKLTTDSWVIMELSSFQLIDSEISPHIAVVLNITLDHMDWHKSRKEYVDAKRNIVKHQKPSDFSVINQDYSTSSSFSSNTQGKVFGFSRQRPVEGCFVVGRKIYLMWGNTQELVGEADRLLLRGEHNWENVTAAICAAYLAGATLSDIKDVVFSFKGLEHRLELVKKINEITFYNDSFSTNPQPTMAAVDSFSEPITLIMGGSDKGLTYDELGKYIERKGNVFSVVLIGQIALQIEKSLKKAKYCGKIINLGMTTMKETVTAAYKNATKNGVVLLSPATASFGMFKDYKDRGIQFKDCVRLLK